MNEQTPRPWKVISERVLSADNVLIADFCRCGLREVECKDNAALCARACNSHDDLVNACRLITEDDPDNGPRLSFDSKRQFYVLLLRGGELEQARAAIAKAEGEQI